MARNPDNFHTPPVRFINAVLTRRMQWLGGMAARIAYAQEHYRTAAECLAAIRRNLARGWELFEIRGGQAGPFTAVFKIEDSEG